MAIVRRSTLEPCSMAEFCYYFVMKMSGGDDYTKRELEAQALADILERNLRMYELRILGAGVYGAAAETPGGRVLKLTTDDGEVNGASVLQGKKIRNIADIFQVAELDGREVLDHCIEWKRGPMKVRAITLQLLDHVSLGDVEENIQLGCLIRDTKEKYKLWPQITTLQDPDEYRDRQLLASMEIQKRLSEMGGKFEDLSRGMSGLRRYGINAIDVHANNVGWSSVDQEFKIFDISLPKLQNGPKVQHWRAV
jgi:hypothetical protein